MHLLDGLVGDCGIGVGHFALVFRAGPHSQASDEGVFGVAVVDVVRIHLYVSPPALEMSHLEAAETCNDVCQSTQGHMQ